MPNVRQSIPRARGWVLRPSRWVTNKGSRLATLLLAGGLAVGGLVWGLVRDPGVAVASLNYATIHMADVHCVSIDTRRTPSDVSYGPKSYSDPKLPDAITAILSIKTVIFNADSAACPWGFSINVVPKMQPTVRYNGQAARYLVSIAICERDADGTMNADKCISKNIYVFSPHVAPHDLFKIALVGLAKRQTNEWEAFQRDKSQ